MRVFDCTALCMMFVGLRILMVRHLQQQLQKKFCEQCDGGAASERRVRVALSWVGGRWAEPVVRLCRALGRAARAGLLAAHRARDVP